MKSPTWIVLIGIALLWSGSALAANDSPVGKWKTIDDATNQAKSIVEITDQDGQLEGKILELLNRTPDDIARDGEHPVCARCTDARKGQPLVGMVIMTGVTQDGDTWDGGRILDPKNGKTYKVSLKVTNGGQNLEVHGYIGFSLLGRTQTWERVE
ncbi:MAG: DUF2147 domain-containing protein [Xanthomonadales bacterium]|nr:DUF2147 domain-containing protein [Xanthomonadales bacterium]